MFLFSDRFSQILGELKRLEKYRISCQIKNQSSLALNTFTKETPNTNNNNNNNKTNNNNDNNHKNNNNISNANSNNENLANQKISKETNNLIRTYDESSSNSSPSDENSNSSNGSNNGKISNIYIRDNPKLKDGNDPKLSNNSNNNDLEYDGHGKMLKNTDGLSATTIINRSHDGVFLRPGAVSRYLINTVIRFV